MAEKHEQATDGFAGLALRVSDITGENAGSKEVAPQPVPAESPPPPEAAAPPAGPYEAPRRGVSNGLAMVLGAAIVLLGLALLSTIDHGDNTSGPAASDAQSTAVANASSPPSPPPVSSAQEDSAQASQAQPPAAAVPQQAFVVEPPAGVDLALTEAQLRYCEIKRVQLGAIQSVVDARSRWQVEQFNNEVGDFNSRCSQFRYRRGELTKVREEVQANQATIAADAISSWRSWAEGTSNKQ